MNEVEVFYPANAREWRKWLTKNHLAQSSVWLVLHAKSSGKPTISWSDAVDAALCFGWIDSKKVKINEDTAHQFFSRRKPRSTWSRINKEKVQRLIEDGLMAPAGYESIEVAQKNGSWTILDTVEALVIPEDLEKAFFKKKGSKDRFLSWSKSQKKIMLQKLVLAKRPETRQKYIAEIVAQTLHTAHDKFVSS